jgi:hypothetical protein
MTTVTQREGESRADYLVRVAVIMLRENAFDMQGIIFDQAEGDGFCLADDLKNEFNIEIE